MENNDTSDLVQIEQEIVQRLRQLVRLTEEGRIILTITYNNDEVIISVANTSAVIPTSSLAILNSVDVPVYWRMDYFTFR
jgi:hypothetical protein